MESLWQNPTTKKAISLAMIAGALIILDNVMPGAGLLLAIAIGLIAFLRSDASNLIVSVLNWGAGQAKVGYEFGNQPKKRNPGSPGSVGG